jgi:hypothetical protein
MNLETARRRQAAALQGASRISMHGGEPKDHGIYAQDHGELTISHVPSISAHQAAEPLWGVTFRGF